jgi:hypothetical protein
MDFPGKGCPSRSAKTPEGMLLVLLIAWIGAIALVACALAKAARRADAQSERQWERWARTQPAPPPLRSRRGGLAA